MAESKGQTETTDEENTLLIFGGALGDFLCLLPGLFSLRGQNRGRISVIAQPAFLELVEGKGIGAASVDRREVADLFSTGALQRSTFDLFGGYPTVHTWIGHGDSNFTTRLAIVSGGAVHIHRLGGMKSDEHASVYLARCLGEQTVPISLVPPAPATRWAADFWRRHHLGDSTLVVHPGSGSPAKNWQGMTTIAHRWRTVRRGPVLLLCGPAEQSVEVPHDAIIRESSLNRVAALLTRAAGYVGNDSGISHLAGLAGAAGVVTFGPSNPIIWHPLGDGLRVCRARSTTCRRCGRNQFCIHLLAIEDVWGVLTSRIAPSSSQIPLKQR